MRSGPSTRTRRESGSVATTVAAFTIGPLLARPDLWWTAVGTVCRMAAPGWWRSRPYLPLPGRRLWAFRMVTAYGRPDVRPPASDVVDYLEWCRDTAVPVAVPVRLARLARRANSRSTMRAG